MQDERERKPTASCTANLQPRCPHLIPSLSRPGPGLPIPAAAAVDRSMAIDLILGDGEVCCAATKHNAKVWAIAVAGLGLFRVCCGRMWPAAVEFYRRQRAVHPRYH